MLFFINNIALGQVESTKVIVNISKGNIDLFIKKLPVSDGSSTRGISYKVLSHDLDIILLSHGENTLDYVESSPYVESWGQDAELSLRGEPNDEFYDTQWGLSLIDTEKAWDISTGGKFDSKHDIVIAVLDDGFDVNHNDLSPNIYTNSGEIPNNNIDDDDNGYTDDFRGLNIETGNDQHRLDDHGTAVAGIIGAVGDNDRGMAGIMWTTKILPISEVTRQSELIESFQYIVDIRRAWNESNGEQGAFIVATNYSAGIDEVFGSDPQFKSWCDMYDLLGEVGILNAGATTNKGINVDELGDMPTTCPSEYLIAVTNTGKNDALVNFAGYGPINIDLGAPGGTDMESMPVLDINNSYGSFNGTSGATPHVAGTIGLLYSIDCEELKSIVYSNPRRAAELVREAILKGIDPNTSLDGKVKTNGRLNTWGAIQQLNQLCVEIDGETEILEIRLKDGDIEITYRPSTLTAYDLMITDPMGRVVYRKKLTEVSTGTLTNIITGVSLIQGMYYFSIYNDKEISTKSLRLLE